MKNLLAEGTPNPESRIPNPESRILLAEGTPNPESRIPNPESRIPNRGGSMKKLFLRIFEDYSPNRGRRTRRGFYFSCSNYVVRPPPWGAEGTPPGGRPGLEYEISQCSGFRPGPRR